MSLKIETVDVSARVVADLSLGIYRTPANALKELISNAFDADAHNFILTTNPPEFDSFTCVDDGHGMTFEEFSQIMKRIGGSSKRSKGQFSELGRPLIGNIGIGLLAAGQICDEFVVISSKKGVNSKFESTIDLTQFDKEEARKHALSEKKITIGTYTYVELPEKSDQHYTKIILRKIKSGFQNKLRDYATSLLPSFFAKDFTEKAGNFQEFVDKIGITPISKLTEYDRMIWELAIQSPITYLDKGPIKTVNAIPTIRKKLAGYNFHVWVDGFELRKPIEFPNIDGMRKRIDYGIYQDLKFNDIVEGKRLKFGGYVYQQAVGINPPELRGILVRIRNVGIGRYDRSLLNFPINVGPILSGTSGEIYVEKGLEDALNIDRNGFRETDSHFQKIQELVFKRLEGPWPTPEGEKPGIMSDARKRSRKRVSKKRLNEVKLTTRQLQSTINSTLDHKYRVQLVESEGDRPVVLNRESNKILVNELNKAFPRERQIRRMAERILCFYEVARAESSNKSELDSVFLSLLTGSKEVFEEDSEEE
jgi:hypothetical protein